MLADRALDRLEKGAARDAGSRTFTSDLSVDELVAVEEAGFEPRELVMGTCVFRLGWQYVGWTESREVDVLTAAMYQARELAIGRLAEEAARTGSDGVVGVRLEVGFAHWGAGMGEFTAIGTAVRHRDRPGSFRTPIGNVFTSDLSGQDLLSLVLAGYRPLGLVMGTCVYHYAPQSLGRWFGNITQNAELPNLTGAFYKARELAMERMQREGLQLGAEGIVGVRLEEKAHVWGAHTLEFFALGTGVRALDPNHLIAKPELVLGLDA